MKEMDTFHTVISSVHKFVFGITTVISLAIYLQTVSSSIAGGDAGELVAEGCKLGTSHPPGYPLYTILVFLITRIGSWNVISRSPAYYANIMSSFFGATASGLIASSVMYLLQTNVQKSTKDKSHGRTKTTIKKTNKRSSRSQNKFPDEHRFILLIQVLTSIITGLLHSLQPLAWQYSVTAEVFALHNFFVALISHTAIRFSIYGTKKLLLLGSFICGLALTNQHTSILLVAPISVWVFTLTKLQQQALLFFQVVLFFLLGLFPVYVTLPYFATYFPHHGSWGDVTTLYGFLNHVRRKDYGTLRLFSGNDDGSEGLLPRLKLWCQDFSVQQINPLLFICFVLGCKIVVCQGPFQRSFAKELNSKNKILNNMTSVTVLEEGKRMRVGKLLFISLLFYLVVFHSLANLPLSNPLFFGIHQRFWMHANVIATIIMGLGLGSCFSTFARQYPNHTNMIFLVLFLIPYHSYRSAISMGVDQSENNLFRNYAVSILNTLPKNSLLFINYDQQWTSVRYMQECEGVRKDVTSINLSMMSHKWWKKKRILYPKLIFPGSHYTNAGTHNSEEGGFSFSNLLDANHNNLGGNIFIGGHLSYTDIEFDGRYKEIPHGIVRKIVRIGSLESSMSAEIYRQKSAKIWKRISKEFSSGIPDVTKYSERTWEWTIRREFFDHFVSRATHLLDLAIAQEKGGRSVLKSLVEASAWMEIAKVNDDMTMNSVAIWKNLGLAYMHIVRSNEVGTHSSFPLVENIFSDTNNSFLMNEIKYFWWNETNINNNGWKEWSSNMWKQNWGHFLTMESAKIDSNYESVKQIYDAVIKSTSKNS